MSNQAKLVYSSDPAQNRKCPRCKELVGACSCPKENQEAAKTNFVAVLRLEKQGRGGKTVTVIDRLPRQEAFLKALCTELKKKCGSGGSYREEEGNGVIEIQGDQRERIRAVFATRGIRVKGM